MEQLEAWLRENGIVIVSQYMTGSGDMLRLRLRLTDGFDLDVALSAAVLVETPSEAVEQVRRRIESYQVLLRHNRGNGHS